MAALSGFPPHCVSLSSRYSQSQTSSAFSFFCHHSCFHTNRRYINGQFSIVCLANIKKSRPSRKLMGDDELCNALREFVASVGLPADHVPSTKELNHHGRKDLANIVRRRGHKLIKQFLVNPSETESDGNGSLKNLNGDSQEKRDYKETGQEGKLHNLIEDPISIPSMDDNSDAVTSALAEDESTSTANGVNHVLEESTMTLQEKVDNFMKHGVLDPVEVDACDDIVPEEGGTVLNHGQSEVETVPHSERDYGHLARISDSNIGQNGTLLLPRVFSSLETEGKSTRDIYSSAQETQNDDLDDELVEAGKRENEAEISRLKQILHQKELELSLLKEEIEKEKYALSLLQTKAENEITKAQKLISEKDAELFAVEESLSGLVEAKIEYSGEGEMVEVAGSFNGWHQWIKLDPQPSSVIVDPVESRRSRRWSTTLWLYPGVYEIKFIVDGHWKIDPQKELINKNGVENNILRVDR
ncbi:protein PTST homolog 3, chloroplastic [Amaranthus tricolor]|uniref:protein PTST homolog 3, chloroplastic n=1 Tax=Amaranthus tricolor TaxID=29722 RepID=UPI002589F205|nr:protein PTST homolog 3, chloroplastic [Amaranthus tricolor]